MKYIFAASMLGSLIAAFLLIQLGFSYQTEGFGLHPVVAGMGVLVMLAIGWIAAHLLANLEE